MRHMNSPTYVVLDVHGGMGKHIAATAVVANLKAAYPESKLIVVCAYPPVFWNHPDVFRVYGYPELRYFYNDYLKGKDFLFHKHEPYHHTDYIKKTRHLIDVWTEQCQVPLKFAAPKIYLNHRELQYCQNKYVNASPKPILLLQASGGMNLPFPYSWVRDIPIPLTQKLIDNLSGKFNILHIHNKNQPSYQNTTSVTLENLRELIGLVKVANRRLLIDSFAQHATAALGEKAVVLWPINNVKILGYETNQNILSNRLGDDEYQSPFSYIEDHNLAGNLHECPFDSDGIFNLTEIVEALTAPDPRAMGCAQ